MFAYHVILAIILPTHTHTLTQVTIVTSQRIYSPS